jgi:hypothetical protein
MITEFKRTGGQNMTLKNIRSRTLVSLLFAPSILFFALQAQAQQDVILPSIGGLRGGAFIARCPQGRLLTGVDLRVGDDIDAIGPICTVAYSARERGVLEFFPTRIGGTGGGGDVQVLCPKENPVVAGIFIRAEGVRTITVNNVHLFCGVAGPTQSLSPSPSARYDGPSAKPDEGPFGLNTDGVQRESGGQQCPPGLVGVGVAGRAGIWLDAMGLICGAPTLTIIPVKSGGPVVVEKPTVKKQGRVKLDPGAPPNPLKPICELANGARARNSPTAPGLEKTCRAELAATGAAIAQKDPVVANARNVDPLAPYRFGFDISTAMFGDPALGARGNTATGPGSLGIRNALDANGQRGFNDSVKLHLSRNYTPPSGPRITIVGAVGTDIATIYMAGQTQRAVNVGWNASPDYAYCEIYVSVNNGEWIELGRGRDGTKLVTLKLGSSYTFRMMVYEGQTGTPRIIRTRTLSAAP